MVNFLTELRIRKLLFLVLRLENILYSLTKFEGKGQLIPSIHIFECYISLSSREGLNATVTVVDFETTG